MKNVNLTGLYMALIAKCGVMGFELSSVRRVVDLEPSDVMLDFYANGEIKANPDEIKAILDANITGEVKQATVKLTEFGVHIYIEFIHPHPLYSE